MLFLFMILSFLIMTKFNKSAFRGPHKINFGTVPSGFAFKKMCALSKYANFEYTPLFHSGDLVLRHYGFFERIILFIKQLFK